MKEESRRVLIDVSWSALLKIVGLCLGLWVVFFLRDIIIMLFVVFILVAAINPFVTRLQQSMSRPLAVTLVYALLALAIALLTSGVVPILVHQFNDLVRTLPQIMGRIQPHLASLRAGNAAGIFEQATNSLVGSLNNLSDNIFQISVSFVSNLATAVTGIVISFYLLLEETNAKEFFHQLLPQHRFESVYHTVSKIAERMGSWVRGQLLLMLIIGISNLLAYLVLGIHSPLPLAIWAGLCELIPIVGPVLGLIPATIVALTTGALWQAIAVLAVGLILIQQLEMHIVVPRVMGRAVGLSPVLVILALLVGTRLFGLVGALVSVPAAAVISVVVGEWPNLRKLWEVED